MHKKATSKLALVFSLVIHMSLIGFFAWWSHIVKIAGDGQSNIEVAGGGASRAASEVAAIEAFTAQRRSAGDFPAPEENRRSERTSTPATSAISSAQGGGDEQGGAGDTLLAEIRRRILRSKYYPLIARQQRLEGASEVAFEIDEKGSAKNVRIVASSGHEFLDEAASKAVQRASPFPSYDGPITVTLRYRLE